jgi:hypothetical protein
MFFHVNILERLFMGLNFKTIAAVACASVITVQAEGPSVNFSGFLDADAWADMTGTYYANSELDLGLTTTFTDKVSAHVYATINNVYSSTGGNVPAGPGVPSERWLNMVFDGYDITYASKLGTFTVGDLVYQYGKFNYYFYKRFSMITNENFSRGIKYGNGNDKISTELQVGIADVAGDPTVGDLQGMTKYSIAENHSVSAFYGVRGSSKVAFKTGSDFFAGLEYNGTIGASAKVKFDLGYQSLKASDTASDRANVVTLLLEPSLTIGKFSLAMTGYAMVDPDSANDIAAPIFTKVTDDWFVYAEPGVTFNDYLALGLPVEYHGKDADIDDDDEFWLVPTFYVYPTKDVQWWIWGQMVAYNMTDKDPIFAAGSEIIVTF